MGRGVARSSRLGGGAAHRTDSRWPGEEPWHGTLASRPCVWLLSRANERGERAPCVDLAAQLLCSSSMAPGSSGIEPQARVGALQSAPIVTAASGSPKSGVVQQSVSSRTPLPPSLPLRVPITGTAHCAMPITTGLRHTVRYSTGTSCGTWARSLLASDCSPLPSRLRWLCL